MKSLVMIAIVFFAVFFLSLQPAWANDAEALWKKSCASCHAADGSGNTPMGKKMELRDIRSPEVQKQTDEELYTITAKGQGKMPGYEKKLSKEQIDCLVRYMRELAKK